LVQVLTGTPEVTPYLELSFGGSRYACAKYV